MSLYISAKKLPATDTKGTRIRAKIETVKGTERVILPYNYALSLSDNLERAAYQLTQKIMSKYGWNIETPVLSMIVNEKTGIPVGFILGGVVQ